VSRRRSLAEENTRKLAHLRRTERDDDDFVSPPMTALDTYRESATARASIIEEDGCTRRAVTPDNAARLLPSFKQESLQGGRSRNCAALKDTSFTEWMDHALLRISF